MFISLVFCLLIFILTDFSDRKTSIYSYKDEVCNDQPVKVTGIVSSKEIKNNNQIIYLKNIVFNNDSDSMRNANKKELERFGLVCYLDDDKYDACKIGSKICLTGQLGEFNKARNEGEFDLRDYYLSKTVIFPIYKCRVTKISKKYNIVKQKAFEIREYFSYIADKLFCENDAGIMKSVLLGDKSELSNDIKDLYKASGISHILAISGLHISLIGMGLYKILRWLRNHEIVSVFISVTVMIIYGFMSGESISTVRAIFMFILLMAAKIFRRTYDLLTALSLSALYIAIINPYAYLSNGFYLSFAAVFGISVFSKSFEFKKKQNLTGIRSIFYNIYSYLLSALLAGFSVNYFTFALLLYFFFEYPTYSILLNIIVVPLMSVLVTSGILAILIGIFNYNLAVIFAIPCHYILKLYGFLSDFFRKMPADHIVMGKPSFLALISFYLITLLIIAISCLKNKLNKELLLKNVMEKRKGVLIKKEIDNKELIIKRLNCLKVFLLLFGIVILINWRSGLKIYMLDVGQGDGLFISYKNLSIMVDGGSSSEKELAQYKLIPFLKSKGVNRINYYLISHPDSDHISGLIEMLENDDVAIKIDTVLLPDNNRIYEDARELIDLIKSNNIKIDFVKAGDKLLYKDLALEFINPISGKEYVDANTYSEVFLLSWNKFKMLFTGDSTIESEKDYISFCKENNITMDVDLLKVPHHGSDTSSSDEMLDFINSEIAIISCGKNNRYGHPKKTIIDRLINRNSNIYITKDLGEIIIKCDKNGYNITAFNK